MSDPAVVGWEGEDLHAWHILRPLLDRGGYLPWSTGSMRPAGLVVVCNDIVHGARTRIVECGSGVSTVVLARLLGERGAGGVVALEHDAHWAAVVRDQLRRESLHHIARVIDAPLQGDPPWYASGALAELPTEVDLLVVDGPPAGAADRAALRTPALERLASHLADGATVILDDIARPGERDVVAGWQASGRWRFEIDERAGVAVGRRPR